MSEENKYTFENEEYRQTYWHTCSHIMAQAVKRLWPEVKLAIGPSIKEGWYYDMLAPFSFTPEHMEQIEAEMKKICKENLKIERFELRQLLQAPGRGQAVALKRQSRSGAGNDLGVYDQIAAPEPAACGDQQHGRKEQKRKLLFLCHGNPSFQRCPYLIIA